MNLIMEKIWNFLEKRMWMFPITITMSLIGVIGMWVHSTPEIGNGRVDEGLLNACNKRGPLPIEICGNNIDENCNGLVDEPGCKAP